MNQTDLEQYYKLLELDLNASLEEIQQAYLKQIDKQRRQGNTEEINTTKVAYHKILEQLNHQAELDAKKTPKEKIIEAIQAEFRSDGFKFNIKLHEHKLDIYLDANDVDKKRRQEIVNRFKLIFFQSQFQEIDMIMLYGLKDNNKLIWKQKLFNKIDNNQETNTETILQQAEETTNALAFPLGILLAISLTITQISFLWRMWIHELGHASIAWFYGYRAIPTLAVTGIIPEKSWFVYLGILILLGLLVWTGKREQKPWLVFGGIALILVQFFMTWMMPENTYQMLQAFGGVGGEFYLSTLIMVCFYLPLPEKWRWDFWRYIGLIVAASTFLDVFWQWRRIDKGREFIPWGTFWGGRGDMGGDMNQLSQVFGWSDNAIINTYRTLGNVCLWVIIGVYIYFTWRCKTNLWLAIKKLFSQY